MATHHEDPHKMEPSSSTTLRDTEIDSRLSMTKEIIDLKKELSEKIQEVEKANSAIQSLLSKLKDLEEEEKRCQGEVYLTEEDDAEYLVSERAFEGAEYGGLRLKWERHEEKLRFLANIDVEQGFLRDECDGVTKGSDKTIQEIEEIQAKITDIEERYALASCVDGSAADGRQESQDQLHAQMQALKVGDQNADQVMGGT